MSYLPNHLALKQTNWDTAEALATGGAAPVSFFGSEYNPSSNDENLRYGIVVGCKCKNQNQLRRIEL